MQKKLKDELKSKDQTALAKEITKRELEVAKLAIDIAMGKVKNVSSLDRQKDDLAVVKTFYRQNNLIPNT